MFWGYPQKLWEYDRGQRRWQAIPVVAFAIIFALIEWWVHA